MLNLFRPVAPRDRWHSLFAMLMNPSYLPEQKILQGWAAIDLAKFAYRVNRPTNLRDRYRLVEETI